MGVGKGILWKGNYYVRPQAASFIDSGNLSPVQLGSGNKLVIMGDMTGIIVPKTPTRITPGEALAILEPTFNEEPRLAAQLAFSPSKGGMKGASEVYLMAVNAATNATVSNASYKLDSYIYGSSANQISVKQENGTLGGKKLTIHFQDSTEVIDNLTKTQFTIQYAGAGTCTMTVANSAGIFTITTSCGTTPADDINIVSEYDATNATAVVCPTIQSVFDTIDAKANYTLTMKTGTARSDKTVDLDTFTAADIKTAAYSVKADLKALIDGVNNKSGYVQASKISGASTVVANYDYVYLTGGTDYGAGNTVSSIDDWKEAYGVLSGVDIQLVLPLTSDTDVWAYGDAHCQYMSMPAGKSERVQFVGGDPQTWTNSVTRKASRDALAAQARKLNSDRTMLVGICSSHYDPDGAKKLYPAYITAAMYAGISAGNEPTLPLTRKYLNCIGLEVELNTTECDELLEAGVAVPIRDMVQGAGYIISRGVTTWCGDIDLLKVEMSVRRGCDYIAKEVRNRHELLVGNPGTEAMDATIINITNAVLQAAKRAEMIRDYDPAKTQLRAEGLTRYVDYSAIPILPINWIFSTYHLQPLNVTITL